MDVGRMLLAAFCASLPLGCFGMADAIAAETPLSVPGPEGRLAGTLLQPSETEPAAVVLIVPGSGPTDRDGNNPLGVQAASYAKLARGLASQGIASLRTDKRGMFASAAAIRDPNAVTIADYVADTRAWTAALQAETKAGCVWLLGHSEGALVALAAAQSHEGICGLVLVAGPGRPLGAVLREQLSSSLGDPALVDQSHAAIAALESGQRFDTSSLHPGLAPLFGAELQGFLIGLFSYDPAQLIAGLDMPILILQGAEDLQVSTIDARRLHRANPNAELVILNGVNHVLKQVPAGDRQANLDSYADPSLPISGQVVQTIGDFVLMPR